MLKDAVFDYTRTLEFLANHLMGPDCSVLLRPSQFELLKDYLLQIENFAEDFRLEKCEFDGIGFKLGWHASGETKALVDALMRELECRLNETMAIR